jgi:hypothetical protein
MPPLNSYETSLADLKGVIGKRSAKEGWKPKTIPNDVINGDED